MLRVHFQLARDGLGQRLHEEAADLHEDAWLRHRCGGVRAAATDQCSQGMRPSATDAVSTSCTKEGGWTIPGVKVSRASCRRRNSPAHKVHATLDYIFELAACKTLAHSPRPK